ncbi:MAG: 1-(5-phosphoribosyl)-5-[(5-phosphoribosylamino)methylideneamino]imidazole-4-carboxamide isomerase [Actinomycetota bacterium]
MIVIPAIDLRGGRAVRLFRGDPEAETEYATEPVEVAKRFEEDGARRLHLVDLDAALGTGDNRESVKEIIRTVAIPVQLGGGIRTMEALDTVLAPRMAERAVLGTAAAANPDFVRDAVAKYDDRIVVAVDVKDGRVMVRGWQEAGPPIEESIPALTTAGSPRYLVTSIKMDGTMDGPDTELYERVIELAGDVPVIASGGVRNAEDVWGLRELGCEAAVVGKAFYVGTIKLSEVVRG